VSDHEAVRDVAIRYVLVGVSFTVAADGNIGVQIQNDSSDASACVRPEREGERRFRKTYRTSGFRSQWNDDVKRDPCGTRLTRMATNAPIVSRRMSHSFPIETTHHARPMSHSRTPSWINSMPLPAPTEIAALRTLLLRVCRNLFGKVLVLSA